MSDFLSVLQFAFQVTGPICVVIVLGIFLARIGLINDAFIDVGSRLVFNITLPSLLFISISKTSFEQTANLTLVIIGLVGTFLVYLVLEVLARYTIQPPEERGVVVQGAFRSNMGIVGLAYCVNAYGEVGLAAASLYMGIVVVLYNALAVITLNRSLSRHGSVLNTFKGIVKNPLIIGIVLALPFAWLQIPLPNVLLKSGEYFAQMTLPLALLCAGGSLSLQALRYESRNALLSSIGKLIFAPLLITGGGYWVGLRGMELGILFLMTSAPTAAASYVMVRAMGGNATLAANIVVLTTLGSLVATSIGVAILRGVGLI